MGHIPSTRRIGEITTPRAISRDRTTSFRTTSDFLIFICLFCLEYEVRLPRSVGNCFSPLTPKHGFPSLNTKPRALPLSPPHSVETKSRRNLLWFLLRQYVISITSYGGITHIRFKGRRSYLPLSLSLQAPLHF